MSDSQAAKAALKGYFSDVRDGANVPATAVTDPDTMAKRCTVRKVLRYTKAVDGGSGTPVAEVPIFAATTVPIQIRSVTFTPDSTLATAGTNFMTVTIQKRTVASSYVTTGAVVTFTTNTGGQAFTQWTPIVLMAETAAAVSMAKNDILTYTNAKTGTGAALPGGVFEIEYEEAY